MKGIMKNGLTGALAVLLLSSTSAWGACTIASGESAGVRHIDILINKEGTIVSSDSFQRGMGGGRVLNRTVSSPIGGGMAIRCERRSYIVTETVSMPEGPPVSMEGSEMFKTGLDGIGVYITGMYGNIYPKSIGSFRQTAGSSSANIYFDLSFLNMTTNEIDFGVIDGSNLPTGRIYVTESPSGIYDDSAVLVATFSFTGAMTIKNPTCNTIDKNIFMGNYTPEHFTGIGSGSPWMDGSLNIICSTQFHGGNLAYSNNVRYDNATGSWGNTDSEWININNNEPFIQINPVYGYLENNIDNGIIALENSSDQAASGIGIQLGYAPYDGAELMPSEIDPTYLFSRGKAEINTNVITIPLFARYVQTGDSVSPGRADSKVIYTLNYK